MTKKTTSPDDSALFRNTVGKVKTIDTNTVSLQPAGKPRPFPKTKPLEQIDPLQKDISEKLDMLFQEDRIAFLAPGLQKNVLKKLRKGQYGLDAEIDLHGLTSRNAKQQLLNFLHDCVENGIRCVHVIHGKGYNSPDSQPVLKNDINLWLRQHQDVLAFCSAPPKAGGSGAVFVLLRFSAKFGAHEEDI
ncbi:Smr/MutS family protein [Methylomonas sp. EFPC3]|uniref:Smr/MutS family protein n=1 Tax=Methylomonas sp. EFPC3 TaxID=3021710 RepID=UPI002417D1D2|nr:Smr/MutS family protein [Methylomonas sp. EFPC3]WFP48609.1 Smr/MutS family protein [Methylomonas sp. EFPC3]